MVKKRLAVLDDGEGLRVSHGLLLWKLGRTPELPRSATEFACSKTLFSHVNSLSNIVFGLVAASHSARLKPVPVVFSSSHGCGTCLVGWGTRDMRNLGLAVALAVALAGCAIQRAQVAQDARAQMVGLSKEQVLGCMGPSGNKAAEGQTEVWSYASGNGFSSTVATADVNTTGQASRIGNQVYGSANSTGFGTAVSTRRFCTVNVVMTNGLVSAVNYQGPTGGLLTAGEQCAFAVDACVKKQ